MSNQAGKGIRLCVTIVYGYKKVFKRGYKQRWFDIF